MFVFVRNLFVVRVMGFGMLVRMVMLGLAVPVPVRMNDDLPRAAALAAILDADFSYAFTFRTSCFCH